MSLPYFYIFVFLSYRKNFPRELKSEFELATVNEPSVFESLEFFCIYAIKIKQNCERKLYVYKYTPVMFIYDPDPVVFQILVL